jgi:hypothetical protein
VNCTDPLIASNIPGPGDSSAVLTLTNRSTTTARFEIIGSLHALVLATDGARDGASFEPSRTERGSTGFHGTFMVVSTVVPAVVSAVMTSVVASIVMTRSLRGMRGVMSGSSTLWTALELQGTPDPALPALRRRVIIGWIVIRDTAALTFVPVEPRGRTITT